MDLTASDLWEAESSELSLFLEQARRNRLEGYRLNPRDVEEHANIEARVREGGYRDRHVYELVQNAADAAREAGRAARVELLLTDSHLYVANDGAPLRQRGVETLLASHLSDKTGDDIGRFGLGFKSVLGIADRIEFLSRSGSLSFDADRANAAIRAGLPVVEGTPIPVLRMAWPLNPVTVFAEDRVLAGLRWATSIVRVTLRGRDEHDRVAKELARFPTAFVLFVGVPLTLRLDAGGSSARTITATEDGPDRLLQVEKVAQREPGLIAETTRWRVFSAAVQLTSPDAIADAGRLHARARVPVAWAVPVDAERIEMGEFWAFFPLQERSRLPGIVNAPWKTNDDRTNLLPGAYNDELCGAMADLVALSLPTLPVGRDPGVLLDLLPRRDGGSAPAEKLAQEVWLRVAHLAIVPDGTGALRPANALRAHPYDSAMLSASWLDLADPKLRSAFVHDAALRGKRAGRWRALVELQKPAPPATPSLSEWVELVRSVPDATRVVALMGAIHKSDSSAEVLQALRGAQVLPTTVGSFAAANGAFVGGGQAAGAATLSTALIADEPTRQILSTVLKVGAFGDAQWVALLRERFTAIYIQKHGNYSRTPSPAEHQHLWEIVASAPAPAVRPFVTDPDVTARLHVLAGDGIWRPWAELIAPGRIVPESEAGGESARWVVDPGFARTHLRVLKVLGLDDVPSRHLPADKFKAHPLLTRFCVSTEEAFAARCAASGQGNPQRDYLRYLTPSSVPTPIGLLHGGGLPGRIRLTGWLLDEYLFEHALYGHLTQGVRYPPSEVPHPLAMLLWQHGVTAVDGANFRLCEVSGFMDTPFLDPAPEAPDLNRHLRALWSGFPTPPPAERPSNALLACLWRLVDADDLDDSLRQRLLSRCAVAGWLPSGIRLGDKVRALSEVYATEQQRLFDAAKDAGHPVILVDLAALAPLRKAGVKVLADQLRIVIVGEPPMPFEAAFPELADVVQKEHQKRLEVVFGTELALEATGGIRTPLQVGREGTRIFVDRGRVSGLSRSELEDAVLVRMAEAGWLTVPVAEVRMRQRTAAKARLHADLAKARDLAERLLAIAGSKSKLLGQLPADLSRMAAEANATPKRIAELFLSVHGADSLRVLASELEASGYAVPARWGSGDARALASALGFPPGFSGVSSGRRDPDLLVPGPVRLGDLHDYQTAIVRDLSRLLASSLPRRRAIISLPTGAGKTRVAVEAVVAAILTTHSRAPVLWVAQSDELCEQAVQCFRQVWSVRGSEHESLKISRLWGSNSGDVTPHIGGPHVVVATIQTLSSRMDRQSLGWLATPSIVIIDEAHHAISPTYTGLLRWIENASGTDPCAVIGLTATPFKGFDDGETLRLARRFDQRLLPSAEEQPHLYARLQAKGILARVDHELLDPPETFEFSADEIREIEMFGGQHFPESAARRLTLNANRNDRILNRVLAAPNTERILLFAGSPDHARMLAGALTLRGRGAGAVVAETRGGTRQHLISEFHAGRLPVLTNFGVLTTGFDAPKVDTLLIARPTFSPVLYQQMIGRGLRGELNGGKARCRLITVRDNFTRFGERLAFHHFLPLFDASQSQQEDPS